MASQGMDIEIFVLKGGARESRLPRDEVTLTIASAGDDSQPQNAGRFWRTRNILLSFIQLGKMVRSVTCSDLVMLTSEMGAALLLPSLAAFLLRKPTLAIVQNNIQHSLEVYSSLTWKEILRWSYDRAFAVVCVSDDVLTLAEGLYGDLVETGSVPALANALEKHLRDPQRLIDKARASEKQSDRFSIDECSKLYITLIRQHLIAN